MISAEELQKLFDLRISAEWVSIPPDTHEQEESGDDDVVDTLRQNTPCIACRETCERAALEIERLRLQEQRFSVPDGDILLRLNSAIFGTQPCGSKSCIVPGVHFLRELRDEICRLRVIEAKARSLSSVAKRVWRGESKSLLLNAALSFDAAVEQK